MLVRDGSRGEAPALLLSGGALLVGDVGRPDLLGGPEETEQHASELCHPLKDKVLTLDDFVEVCPTHVAGSLCGGPISSRLSTTIGYERRMNKMLAGGMLAWRTAALPIRIMPEWTVWDLETKMKDRHVLVLDVRQPNEWSAGHIEGAMHLSGAELPKRAQEVPKNRPVAVMCGSGYRSSVSASLLLHEGHPDGTNVLGGMAAWKKAGLPVTKR